MFDTYVTVTGNALNTPERKTTAKTNAVVASFRVASHARRFDKVTQQWVDAPSLRIRVNCWRRLAENVCASIVTGDPVIVYGRIATREWLNEQGETRISYEIEAEAVGHDLARGRSTFTKTRSDLATTVIEDEDFENRVNGEPTVSFRDDDVATGASYGEFPSYPGPTGSAQGSGADTDAIAILRGAGLDLSRAGEGEDAGDADDDTDEEATAAAVGSGGSGRGRRRGRQPVPA